MTFEYNYLENQNRTGLNGLLLLRLLHPLQSIGKLLGEAVLWKGPTPQKRDSRDHSPGPMGLVNSREHQCLQNPLGTIRLPPNKGRPDRQYGIAHRAGQPPRNRTINQNNF